MHLSYRPSLIYVKPKLAVRCPVRPITTPRRRISPKATPLDVTEISYFVGKGIILFTLYYCSLNWMHYRRVRKEAEEKEKK